MSTLSYTLQALSGEGGEWMAFSLFTDLLSPFPCDTLWCEGLFRPRFLLYGRPASQEGMTPGGSGFTCTPCHPYPGIDGGRQSPLELRPFADFFWFTGLYGLHNRETPRSNFGKWWHTINYNYPSICIDLSLSTKHTHPQKVFPTDLSH